MKRRRGSRVNFRNLPSYVRIEYRVSSIETGVDNVKKNP